MFKHCGTCRKKRLFPFIKKRSYICKSIGNVKITSTEEICRSCFKNIKKLVE